MIVSMIAAAGKNLVIGNGNDIPWHLPDDFAFFKKVTKGHHVIMGRKSWESLPPRFRPLPDRPNVVITRQQTYQAAGALVVSTLGKALEVARSNEETEAFIIGGGAIYRLGLDSTDIIYLTEIDNHFEGQVTFPKISLDQWKEVSRVHHLKDEHHQHAFDFVVYKKKYSTETGGTSKHR